MGHLFPALLCVVISHIVFIEVHGKTVAFSRLQGPLFDSEFVQLS